MITARVSWRAVTAAIAALNEMGELRSDPRALAAAQEFRDAIRIDVEREMEYVNSPPPLPVFLRKQAE
jgi:hypothetical protein